jgi:hypothetical protein
MGQYRTVGRIRIIRQRLRISAGLGGRYLLQILCITPLIHNESSDMNSIVAPTPKAKDRFTAKQ